jgi:acetoin utilization protein AcuB
MKNIEVPVEEFTTPNPITAHENDPVEALANLMRKNGIRHIPILRSEKVVGIVSDRDIKVIEGLEIRDKSLVLAKHIMSPDPIAVDASTAIDHVALEMSKRKIGSVIVYEGGKFLGIFTSTDALNALVEIVRSARS